MINTVSASLSHKKKIIKTESQLYKNVILAKQNKRAKQKIFEKRQTQCKT